MFSGKLLDRRAGQARRLDYDLLPTAHRSLPTAHCPPLTAYCPLAAPPRRVLCGEFPGEKSSPGHGRLRLEKEQRRVTVQHGIVNKCTKPPAGCPPAELAILRFPRPWPSFLPLASSVGWRTLGRWEMVRFADCNRAALPSGRQGLHNCRRFRMARQGSGVSILI